jgi:hypothetical protein
LFGEIYENRRKIEFVGNRKGFIVFLRDDFMAFSTALWVMVTLAALVVLIVIFKSKNQVYLLTAIKNNLFYFFVILIVGFAAYSVIRIHTSHNFDYSTFGGWKEIGGVYYGWLANIFSNVVKVTGYAVDQQWVVTNSTTGKT